MQTISVPTEKGKTMTEMKGKVYLTKDDMPKHCSQCPFCNSSDECSIQDEDANFFSDTWDDLRCDCPLEEIDPKPKVVETDQFKGWIPVTDRLPEEMKPVLAWTPMGEFLETAMWTGIRWEKTWDFDTIYTVTHWMPLPEPPKEAER